MMGLYHGARIYRMGYGNIVLWAIFVDTSIWYIEVPATQQETCKEQAVQFGGDAAIKRIT